jgi:serine-type D-Ala-D-Ala endopeptidase (penicillin-binding protein 7)
MNRSTLFFGSLSVLLLIALGVTVWHIATTEPAELRGLSVAALGLPGQAPDTSQQFQVASAILYNTDTGTISYEQNAFDRRPIASITKLMTAMVALDHGIEWEKEADIQLSEYFYGGKLRLAPGETVTMRDLFMASLVSSANNATQAMVRQSGIPEQEFIRRMNTKAIELSLEQTQFTEGTGLDPENISTAYEVAKIAAAAFQYPDIAEATSRYEYSFTIKGSGRQHTIRNSNKIFTDENQQPLSGSKTGYLLEAGYCLVVRGQGEQEHKIAVILGSPSESGHFRDIQRLLQL